MKPGKTLTMVLVLVVMLVGAVATTAGVFPGHHRRGARGFRLPGLKTFIELNLSDSQRSQLLNILEKYQRERHDTLDSLRDGRRENTSQQSFMPKHSMRIMFERRTGRYLQ